MAEIGTDIDKAAKVIKAGGLVAFPTETVYGLGANALDEAAVQKIFAAKGRPADNPLIIHHTNATYLHYGIKLPHLLDEQKGRVWPGPFTAVIKVKEYIPAITRGGLETMAIRLPAHSVAQELINLAGVPIAAPSANISGKPSPTHHQHVIDSALAEKVDYIYEGGATRHGLESTVVKFTSPHPTLLRLGSMPVEDLQSIFPNLILPGESNHKISGSPGTKYKHYAPAVKLVVLSVQSLRDLNQYLDSLKEKEIVVITYAEWQKELQSSGNSLQIVNLGAKANLESQAANLFAKLIEADLEQPDLIVTHFVSDFGLGRTINERLRRAATEIH